MKNRIKRYVYVLPTCILHSALSSRILYEGNPFFPFNCHLNISKPILINTAFLLDSNRKRVYCEDLFKLFTSRIKVCMCRWQHFFFEIYEHIKATDKQILFVDIKILQNLLKLNKYLFSYI